MAPPILVKLVEAIERTGEPWPACSPWILLAYLGMGNSSSSLGSGCMERLSLDALGLPVELGKE